MLDIYNVVWQKTSVFADAVCVLRMSRNGTKHKVLVWKGGRVV